jgi:hypothetical protein
MCRNVRSIKWHQKTYHKISWDYPFKPSLRYCPSSQTLDVSCREYPFLATFGPHFRFAHYNKCLFITVLQKWFLVSNQFFVWKQKDTNIHNKSNHSRVIFLVLQVESGLKICLSRIRLESKPMVILLIVEVINWIWSLIIIEQRFRKKEKDFRFFI